MIIYYCIYHPNQRISFINIILIPNPVFRLATLFTSKTRLSVLSLYLRHPQSEYGVRETARAVVCNPTLARHELLLLQTAGLLKSRKVANSVQYSLDQACEACHPLASLLQINDGKSAPPAPADRSDANKTEEEVDDE